MKRLSMGREPTVCGRTSFWRRGGRSPSSCAAVTCVSSVASPRMPQAELASRAAPSRAVRGLRCARAAEQFQLRMRGLPARTRFAWSAFANVCSDSRLVDDRALQSKRSSSRRREQGVGDVSVSSRTRGVAGPLVDRSVRPLDCDLARSSRAPARVCLQVLARGRHRTAPRSAPASTRAAACAQLRFSVTLARSERRGPDARFGEDLEPRAHRETCSWKRSPMKARVGTGGSPKELQSPGGVNALRAAAELPRSVAPTGPRDPQVQARGVTSAEALRTSHRAGNDRGQLVSTRQKWTFRARATPLVVHPERPYEPGPRRRQRGVTNEIGNRFRAQRSRQRARHPGARERRELSVRHPSPAGFRERFTRLRRTPLVVGSTRVSEGHRLPRRLRDLAIRMAPPGFRPGTGSRGTPSFLDHLPSPIPRRGIERTNHALMILPPSHGSPGL